MINQEQYLSVEIFLLTVFLPVQNHNLQLAAAILIAVGKRVISYLIGAVLLKANKGSRIQVVKCFFHFTRAL